MAAYDAACMAPGTLLHWKGGANMTAPEPRASERANAPLPFHSDFDVIEAYEECEYRRHLASLDATRLLTIDEHVEALRKAGLHV